MAGPRKLLSPEEVHQHAAATPQWKIVDGKKLARAYTFPDFQSGLHFVNRVGEIANGKGTIPTCTSRGEKWRSRPGRTTRAA
ncbi:MAG: 4a-hydroxytetrahydrobiopterin dehydratase [Ignavibacteriota bacterium]